MIDAWLPDAEDLGRFDGRLMLEWARPDPATGRLVTKTGAALHDAATATVRLSAIFEEGGQGEPAVRWVREDTLRLTSAELDELRQGFDQLVADFRRAEEEDAPPDARPVRLLTFGYAAPLEEP